jgi:hypothetical protein
MLREPRREEYTIWTAIVPEAVLPVWTCAPGHEHGVHPLDPGLGIAWPADLAPVLSEKDTAAPSLEQVQAAGILPGYDSCLGYTAQLQKREPADGQPAPPEHPAGSAAGHAVSSPGGASRSATCRSPIGARPAPRRHDPARCNPAAGPAGPARRCSPG